MDNDNAKNGMRGTGDYSSNQRPGAFGGGIKHAGKSRVSRADVEAMLKKGKRKPKRGK